MTEHHLIQNNTQGPDVSFNRVNLSLEHFGRHVDRGPQHGLGHVLGRAQVLAEAEIAQLDDPVVEEDIVGLHIPVHDVVLVEDLECI